MNQDCQIENQNESKKTEIFGNTEEIEIHRQFLKDQLKWNEELKSNAENSLEFIMGKFKYLFNVKKKLIGEIENREMEIKRLKEILYGTHN